MFDGIAKIIQWTVRGADNLCYSWKEKLNQSLTYELPLAGGVTDFQSYCIACITTL